MNTWLQWLGFDREKIPEDAEVSFRFANLPQSWGVFVFIAVLLAIVWFTFRIYRRENASCPPAAKHGLALLRLLVGLILLVIFLEPSITYTESNVVRPVVALLRDASESMNTEDRYEDDAAARSAATVLGSTVERVREERPTRVDVLEALFAARGSGLLGGLEEKGRLRVLDFSDRVAEADSPSRAPGGDDDGGLPSASDPPAPAPAGEGVADGGAPAVAVDAAAAAAAAGEGAPAAEPAPGGGGASLPPLVAHGTGTDIARAIREALAEKQTSSIVVLTDGQHNSSSDLESAVDEARTRSVPVFFVGLGDPDRPRNLSVANLYADPQVWNNDPFQIQAVLRSEGYGGETVRVELVELPAEAPSGAGGPGAEAGSEIVLESRDVDLPAEGGQLRIDFSHTPKEPGAKQYTVRAALLDDESNTDDNQPAAPALVQVLDDNARVLMVSGGPSWEYRALTRLLMREKMIDLSCWLQSLDPGRQQQGNTPIEALPSTREALFEYDVVLLLDPDPIEFDEAMIDLLKQFVREHSGGILYMPGPVFAGGFLNGARTSGITDLLPVMLGDVGGMEVDSLLSTNNREWPLRIVRANVDQPIMRFFNDAAQTSEQWKKLPGTYWSFPAMAPKPAARVLIEHSDPNLMRNDVARPLLVSGQFGSGRTAYLGFDGTWRWRTKGLDGEFFKRFWIQTTRYLVEGRSLAGKRRGVVEAERFRYQIGDRVRLSARLKAQDFSPLAEENITATIQLPGGGESEIDFRPVDGQPGTYEALFAAVQQGPHRVSIALAGEGAETVELDTNFSVTLPLKEVQQAWLDSGRLQTLAADSGGQYFDPAAALGGLVAALPDRVTRFTDESKPFHVWDNRIALLLLVGLLTLEWALRKRFKLL